MSVAGAKVPESGRLDSLQLLRGFAAFLIVLFHSIHDVNELYSLKRGDTFPDPTALIYGIDLFFVISGFIIVYTAMDRGRGLSAASEFIMRRLVRIVPLYWFFTMLLLAVLFVMPSTVGHLSVAPSELVKSLLFIPYVDADGRLYPFLKIGWTLNYEMYFYALFALCLFLPRNLFVWALSAFFIGTVYINYGKIPDDGVVQAFTGKPIVYNFLLGVWIGYAFKKGIRLPSWMIGLGFLCVALSFFWAMYPAFIKELTGIGFHRQLIAAATVLFMVLPRVKEGFYYPKCFTFIGDSSYSLYLAHSFAIGAIVAVTSLLGLQEVLSPWLVFILCMVGSIIAGGASYLLIEKPLLSVSKRLIFSRKNN